MIELEVCCGSVEDAMNAYKAGARRIELNSALELGGLTPTLSTVQLVRKYTNLEINAMVRVRGEGFFYNDIETEAMFQEAHDLLEAGVDGIVFGFLDEQHKIDQLKTKEMIELIHSYHKKAIFHRAFDVSTDPIKNLHILRDLGIDRILTSGQKNTALEGKEVIKELLDQGVEIVAGSGVNAHNIGELLETAPLKSVHASCKTYVLDPTTSYNEVSYEISKNGHIVVDEELVKALLEELRKM